MFKCTAATGLLAAGCTQTSTAGTVTTETFCKSAASNYIFPDTTSCYTAWSATSYTGTKGTGTGEFCKVYIFKDFKLFIVHLIYLINFISRVHTQ